METPTASRTPLTDEKQSPPSLNVTPSDADLQRMSRALSWLLRHTAPRFGLHITPDGYVPVHDAMTVLAKRKGGSPKTRGIPPVYWTEQSLRRLVSQDAKGRYRLREDPVHGLMIRAEQGHSAHIPLDDDVMLTKITLANVAQYPVAVHGTTHESWAAIQAEGYLSAGSRRHIHFARGLASDGVQSGVRPSATVFLYADLPAALEAGYRFYESKNGVILCSGLAGAKNTPQADEHRRLSRTLPLQFIKDFTYRD